MMKVLVFGAGAIGSYIGGSLALNGNSVVFIERPEVAQEISQRGLHLELHGKSHTIRSPLLAVSLGEALQSGPFDIAIFALKSFDTRLALEGFRPYAAALPPFLCLQNGVENEDALRATFGRDKVIAGTVTTAIGRRAAGDIVLERLRGAGVAAGHPLSESLVQTMNKAGLNAQLFPRASDMKWSKMLTNLVGNASSAILDMTPAEIFADPGLYRLELAQLRETLAVMRALGIRSVNLPATPVTLLSLAVRFVPPALARPFLQRAVGSGRGTKMPSFHIDLHSGRGKSEVDYLNGAVVRFGASAGIATPVNQALNTILLELTSRETPIEAFARRPEKLLSIAGLNE
jgi:2-dehydropantoate 2-reductase